jgi:hypothetical protein
MHLSLLLSAFAAVVQVAAFTNGTLVPAYICNPVDDGMPKAFAQLLPYMRKNGKSVAFDSNRSYSPTRLLRFLTNFPIAGDNFNNATRLNTTAAAPIGNSAYITANFHNSANRITSIEQAINVTTASGGPIVAGQANQLVLNSAIAGVELVGVLIYAKDPNGNRIGTMTDQGGILVPFPGCGLNPEGKTVGVIQTMSVAKNVRTTVSRHRMALMICRGHTPNYSTTPHPMLVGASHSRAWQSPIADLAFTTTPCRSQELH